MVIAENDLLLYLSTQVESVTAFPAFDFYWACVITRTT